MKYDEISNWNVLKFLYWGSYLHKRMRIENEERKAAFEQANKKRR